MRIKELKDELKKDIIDNKLENVDLDKKQKNISDNKNKKKYIFIYALCSILLILYIFCITKVELQNDTLFDIKMGEEYVNKGVIKEDTFSIHQGLKYVSHHFVVNIITYLVYSKFNFIGLYILEVILAIILAVLFFTANKKFLKSKLLSYIFVFIQLYLMIPFISVRAQMYSYILILLEIIFIENLLKASTKNKKILYTILLTLIPLALINFHAGMIYFYFIIITVYALNYFKIKFFKIEFDENINKNLKRFILPFILGMFLIFINPFGIDLITYAIKTLGNDFINKNIAEFLPLNITQGLMGIIAYLSIFIVMFVFISTKKQIKTHHFCMFLGTVFMALLANRHFSVFIVTSVLILPYIEDVLLSIRENMHKGIIEKGKKVLDITVIIFVGFFILNASIIEATNKKYDFLPDSVYANKAITYIKENIGSDKRIFNEYFYGTSLMFNNIKCFIDSRCDLYTEEYNPGVTVANDYVGAINCEKNFNEIMKKYNIEYLLINKDSSLAKNIFEIDGYKLIYQDDLVYIIEVENKLNI